MAKVAKKRRKKPIKKRKIAKKTAKRKVTKRKIAKKTTKRKTSKLKSLKSVNESSLKSCEKTFKQLETKILNSFKKLKKDMSNKAAIQILKKDSHELLLLLGEANFLSSEINQLSKT